MRSGSAKEEYLIEGLNALETCVSLSEDSAQLFLKRKLIERETVKQVLRRLNEGGVRYCLVGGLAVAHHAVPRMTEDLDILVLPEDLPLVRQLLQGHEQHGSAAVTIFQVEKTRIDIIPADLRAKRAAVLNAVEDMLEDVPVKVASLRDLILLKLWAAPERPEQRKRSQDRTDIIGLIELNTANISADDVAYICRSLLAMAYTVEEMNKARAQVEWLNDELEKLGLSDRRFPGV